MAWGDPAVTRLRRQADTGIPYAFGVNNPTTLQHVGLLKRLLLTFNANITNTLNANTILQDEQGPWNILAGLLIRVSGLELLYQVSGWGLYLINLVNDYQAAPSSSGVANQAGTPAQQTTDTDIYAFPASGAQTAQTLLFTLDLPFTVPMQGFDDLGLWLIQNETVNMEVTPTFNTLGSLTLLGSPYDLGGAAATAVVNSGTLGIMREFYGVPSDSGSMPPLGYVHQWEEAYQAVVGSQIDIDHQRGGVILRALYQIDDFDSAGDGSNVFSGLQNKNLTSLQWKYDANDTPFDEDVTNVLRRQRELYGRDLPQGTYTHDFFAQTKTLQDTYDTERYINIKTRFIFAKSLAAGSRIRVIRERLLPVVVNTTAG